MNTIEFTKAMKILTMSYNKDFDEETLKIWYLQFKNINSTVFINAINKKVRESKFMPSIAELLEECEKQKDERKFNILLQMKLDGYFKCNCEYDKAIKFIEENNIPSWLKEDMKKYNQAMIENKQALSN